MGAAKFVSLAAFAWSARQLWWRTGPLLLAGPLLLLGSLLFAEGVLRPLQKEIEQARDRLSTVGRQPTVALVENSAVGPSLATFYGGLPNLEAKYTLIERVYAAAASQNLALEQGEYKLVHEKDGNLSRVEMVLPVKGSYPQVRRFIGQAMRDIPSLALDGIKLQRQRSDEPSLEAQVRLTIYVRQQ